MRKRAFVSSVIPLVSMIALIMTLAVSSAHAEGGYPKGYAEDRAQIEDLLSRYMFAMDFNDPEGFSALFAEDAIFTPKVGKDPILGRAAILKSIQERVKRYIPKPDAKEKDKVWIPAHRHFLSNLVLKVDGNKAYGNAYYGHFGNTSEDRKSDVVAYGHYTDEYVKVNGRWFISSRLWSNETKASHTKANEAFIDPTPQPY